jgi:2-amino-4-hydroxy-6-hydroxymethyldihydropteridine diphosphokinase
VNPSQNRAYLSLGSNVGNRAANLEAAITRLGDVGNVLSVSSFYETEPVEFTAQPWFLNAVVEIETRKSPERLLTRILAIEKEMGRERKQDKGPRIIDIDILVLGDCLVDTAELTIPHPAMHARRFVLEPLVEIAPEMRHPILKKTAQELLKDLPEGQAVRKVSTRPSEA